MNLLIHSSSSRKKSSKVLNKAKYTILIKFKTNIHNCVIKTSIKNNFKLQSLWQSEVGGRQWRMENGTELGFLEKVESRYVMF